MDDLLTYLAKTCGLSSQSTDQFVDIIKIISIEKGQSFVKKGSANTQEYLLLDGICRSYVLDPEGEEITLSFYIPKMAISPNLTRTKSNSSILSIQALTESKLATFSSEDLIGLMRSNREIEAWANAVLQAELMKKVEKEIHQNALNAKERLVAFRENYPLLENQIPHAFIASFLGITNVSLSRLRKELLKR